MLDDLDGVELIGCYTVISQANARARDFRDFLGRCPFCREGTDSLFVDPQIDSYFCTRCLADGHALDFYARVEGLGLSESVRRVRGLLDSGQLEGKRLRQNIWRCMVEETSRFTQQVLHHNREGRPALAWLDRQAVTKTTVETFNLGVKSCAVGRQLVGHLLGLGFEREQLDDAGVTGWLDCKEDRVQNGEPEATILMPVRDNERRCWGFYEQALEGNGDGRFNASLCLMA